MEAENVITKLKNEQKRIQERGVNDAYGSGNISNKQANIYMTGLKTLYPIVQAVAARQLDVETEQDLLAQISKMFVASNTLAKHIVSDLQSAGVNPYKDNNRWALRKILTLSTSSIAGNWMRYDNTDVTVISRMYSNVIMGLTGEITKSEKARIDDSGIHTRMIDNSREFNLLQDILIEKEDFNKDELMPSIAVAVMSGMQPIIFEIERFNWFQEKDSSIERATKKIIEGAEYLFNNYTQSNEVSGDSTRMLMQSCISKSSGLYAECWRTKAQDDLSNVQNMSPDERAVWIAKVKKIPMSMQEIDMNFENMLGYMAAAATKGMDYIKQVLVNHGLNEEDKSKKTEPVPEKKS